MNRKAFYLAAICTALITMSPSLVHNADACSRPFAMMGNRADACRMMRVYLPGPTFPENLAGEVRVSAATDGFARSTEPNFPAEEPVVYRKTSDGWTRVAHKLVDQKNLVKGAKALRLPAPLPGTYSVVWKHETCSDTAAPVGKGKESARFTITPRAEVPRSAGTMKLVRSEVVKQRVKRGEGGDCKPIYADTVRHETELKLTLAPEMKPWGEAPSIALEVDGKIVSGYSPIGAEAAKSGVYTRIHREGCSASDQKRSRRRVSNGKHTAQLVARIGKQDPIRSEPVSFTVSCP